jgi:hypothetical protein
VGVRRRRWYRRKYGRRFRSGAAETFNDKVNWRILHDRRALLLGTCDKLSMKDHATRVASDLVQVPQTLWAGTDIRELAGLELPERWVLKPNHSTKLVILGEGRPDLDELHRATAGWLGEDLAARTGEWAYRGARPLLLVEEFVGAPGVVPDDYKFYVFDGVVRLVQVHTARFVEHQCRVYTTDWEPLTWWTGYPPGPRARARRAWTPCCEPPAASGRAST